MTLLICEGSCNPNLPALDAAVDRHRHDEFIVNKSGTRLPLPDEWLIAQLRRLRHTEAMGTAATVVNTAPAVARAATS